MQTLHSVTEIVSKISFKDWKFLVKDDGRIFIQILFEDIDRISGEVTLQRCRKWYLSPHMVNSEIVRTAFKAVMAAMEHEVEEEFKYKGARIFNPHMDLDNLVDFAKKKENISVRE